MLIFASKVPLGYPRQVPQKLLAIGIWISWQGLCKDLQFFLHILNNTCWHDSAHRPRNDHTFCQSLKIWTENWSDLFPGDMQAYFCTFPHPAFSENLELSPDSCSGFLATQKVPQLWARFVVLVIYIECQGLKTTCSKLMSPWFYFISIWGYETVLLPFYIALDNIDVRQKYILFTTWSN